jgi:chromosome segregation ATPase
MATEHDPSALDAPTQPGGVPRHASAKERKGRGLGPFLSDLKAEVQNQLSRADSQVRTRDAHEHTTQVIYPAGQAQQIEAGPGAARQGDAHQVHTYQGQARQTHPQQGDDVAALASAALATADHAGTEAAAARGEAAAARADAAEARAEAAAARSAAATAQATAARADAQLQGARAEIEAAHQEFGALRAEFYAARDRTRQHILYAWIGAGAAALLAAAALFLPL